jgi:hypothetical protein
MSKHSKSIATRTFVYVIAASTGPRYLHVCPLPQLRIDTLRSDRYASDRQPSNDCTYGNPPGLTALYMFMIDRSLASLFSIPRLSLPFMRAVATDTAVIAYGDGRSCDLVARTGC